MTVHEAVAALRKELAETKETFAARCGLSVSIVYKYEHHRIPEPSTLSRFMDLAEQQGRKDLANIFRDALYRSIGVTDDWRGVAPLECRNSFEKLLVAGLLAAFHTEDVKEIRDYRPAIIEALTPLCRMVRSKLHKQQQRRAEQILREAQKLIRAKGAGQWNEAKWRMDLSLPGR